MNAIELVNLYSSVGSELFISYNQLARPILDILHVIFNSIFKVFLVIAILFSIIYVVMSIYSLIAKTSTKEKKFPKDKAPKVTIQIPTFNELAAIRCAKKCLEFDYPKDKFNIIIGDDSSDPLVSKQIGEFAKEHSNIIVTKRGSNIGYKASNLNYMLKHTDGEIIVLFDSDFVPESDFLKRIVTPFIYDKKIAGVQARWKFLDRNRNFVSILGSTIVTVFHQICLPFLSKKKGISFLCGSAEAVRKSDLVALGKWQDGSFTEDIEFSLRINKSKKKIVYLDKLECYGEVPQTPKDLYKQQMRWAYGVIYSFRQHFDSLYSSKKITLSDKLFISFFCSGYLISFILMILFATGTLSFITHAPAPFDFPKFISESVFNILVTSGIIFASVFALVKTRNIKKLWHMLYSSFSYGLIVTYYVNLGILKVIFNRPMEWFMLNKDGNNLDYNQAD